ncbi:GNAT family N-acetyltransferase [Nocardia sp. NBC_00511]|uniref:GNAT family N-acetyltransferase n=1 Tax=Nocardia sp. NBC_00511 TaxID=2903591 RepID=UPI0030E4E866
MPRSTPAIVATETFSRAAQPVLAVGDGLVLRPWLRRDGPEVFVAFQDPAIRRWHVRSADTAEEVDDWVDAWARSWTSGTAANWAIADARTGRLMGRASLHHMELWHGEAEVAYWVVPAARGRGLASRAVDALAEWAFEVAGFHRLELRHSVHNVQSCRVAAKSAFTLEGVNRSAGLHEDGWHDMHLHARVRTDSHAEPVARHRRATPEIPPEPATQPVFRLRR